MQIFDVVVSIQMKSLKTDVEKGLVVQAFCHQLVGPNREGESLRWNALGVLPRKGIRFIFRNQQKVRLYGLAHRVRAVTQNAC